MDRIKHFLDQLSDRELAYLAKFKLDSYLKPSQQKVKRILEQRDITPLRCEKLLNEKIVVDDSEIKSRCPRCGSSHLNSNKTIWYAAEEIGLGDNIARVDDVFGKPTLKMEVICNVCGLWIKDPNQQAGKKSSIIKWLKNIYNSIN